MRDFGCRSLRYHRGGHESLPRFLQNLRVRIVVQTIGMYPWSPDLADIRAESRQFRTSGVPPVVSTPRQASYTTTKVPRFGGSTIWEQYRQVFDAIVLSNGWSDATAALQLLSHLEGYALNVALLVPIAGQTSRL